MDLQGCCAVCGVSMEVGWVACPFCGWQKSNLLDPNLSIMDIAQSLSAPSCSSNCGSRNKKAKSKCCKRYKKKSKKGPCKRCPKTSVSENLNFS